MDQHPNAEPGDSRPGGGQRIEAVTELGQTAPPPRGESGIHCLSIIGQVEGHLLLPPKSKTTKYEHVIPQLVAVEQSPSIQGLLVVLNTVGGDIEAGLAIAEMIKTLSKPTVSLILGGGHSIGAPIAVAADRSYIAPTATITVHPIRLSGLVIGVPQTYEYLDKMQDRVIRFIVENSRISEAKLRELMFRTGELVRDVGTVLVGAEAVQVGLVDELGGLSDALEYLRGRVAQGKGRVTRAAQGPVPQPAAPGLLPGPQAWPPPPGAGPFPGASPFPGTPPLPAWPGGATL